MINTIIFDIGRVLIGFEWRDYLDGLFDKETADRVTAAMWETRYWHELDRAVLPLSEIVSLFHSAAPDRAAEIDEAFGRVGECVKRRDWVIPLIDGLRANGYRVLYLSNFSEHVMSSNPEALDFLPHMDGGIISKDVHVIKPDPEIYRLLIRKYDLVPEECLFIDDHQENVDAGEALGIRGLVFTDYARLCEDLRRLGILR